MDIEVLMRRVIKCLVMACLILFGLAFFARAEDGETEYIIKSASEGYVLYGYSEGNETPIGSSERLSVLFDYLNEYGDAKKVWFSDICTNERIELNGYYTFCGDLKVSGASLTLSGGDLILENLGLELISSVLRIKEGECRLESGEIRSDSVAVLLDYSASALFYMRGGVIYTNSSDASLVLKSGSAHIISGEIINSGGYAIDCHSSLVIAGTPLISGKEEGIFTSVPITLSYSDVLFRGEVSIKYSDLFCEGEIKAMFYKTDPPSLDGITLYDQIGQEYSVTYFESSQSILERSFGAVYLPYKVNYYCGDAAVESVEVLRGERISYIDAPGRIGYEFLYWSTDRAGDDPYDFNENVNNGFNLYANFKLLPPNIEISSLDIFYDGNDHRLSFSSVTHPLLSESILSYSWYYNGERIPEVSSYVSVRDVSDSGKYFCTVTLTHSGYTAVAKTPEITVKVKPRVVQIPKVGGKEYNGNPQSPDIYSSSVYTVSEVAGTNVGAYPFVLTLRDKENYVFSNGEATANVEFRILKAANYWVDKLSVSNIFAGDIPCPTAHSRFGEVGFLYSDKYNGEYKEDVPTLTGVFYCTAWVEESENYEGLTGEPIEFTILAEEAVGISLSNEEYRKDYKAFEKFDKSGVNIVITYNSSRTETFGADGANVSYLRGDSFRAGDRAVILSYLDVSVSVPVTVTTADYSLDGIKFTDAEFVYDGIAKNIAPVGNMPIGKDGVPLEYVTVGGASDVGIYEIRLEFLTKSENYSVPAPIKATLTVLPCERSVYFENTEFTYDGKRNCPSAYFLNVNGDRVYLSVNGGRVNAGEYTATAVSTDQNYSLTGNSVKYRIEKADYDLSGVSWTDGEFIYDGRDKTVSITGLPDGISVIGYADNRGCDAGKYTARAILNFDSLNYNEPQEQVYEWQIRRAEYDISELLFNAEVHVFDGNTHYPEFIGTLPVGEDGSIPEYKYDRGATHVGEGVVSVRISFTTSSANYNPPEDIYSSVEIIPLGITVTWIAGSYVYNMSEQAPSAFAPECLIGVLGAEKDAGDHIATAISLDSDYYVLNPQCEFTIERADNYWTQPLTIKDIFEGSAPEPSAQCIDGAVRYIYYSENSDTELLEAPTEVGVYFVRATTDGGKNYKPSRTEPVKFKIIKIIPIGLIALLNKTDFVSFDMLTSNDVRIFLENNDGSTNKLDISEVLVSYERGTEMRYGDSCITFTYSGFSTSTEIKVSKADYDMSGVVWQTEDFVYDGNSKHITVVGLPVGVSVSDGKNLSAVNAGEYIASVRFSYDAENYNEPRLADLCYVIKKAQIEPSKIEPILYCAKPVVPANPKNDLYVLSASEKVNAGIYSATLTLCDSANYEFPNSSDTVCVEYEILPIPLTVKLFDIDKYIGSDLAEPAYELIDGQLAPGDTLELTFEYGEEFVTAKMDNPNYVLTVLPGVINYHNSFEENQLFGWFLFLLILLSTVMLATVCILRRDILVHCLSVIRCRLSPIKNKCTEDVDSDITEGEAEALILKTQITDSEIDEITMGIDAAHADSLISDSLAKDLIRRDDVTVETHGRRKRAVNVDTLSDNFSAGDRVDINELKRLGIVAQDTAYVKILARGLIDKPLKVYANDFSLSAVKMIALTGGESIKVVTVRKKNREKGVEDKI